MTEPITLQDIMRYGLSVLKLPPDVFWQMTLKDLIAASEAFQHKAKHRHSLFWNS
jgi:uncharacterized phage protein (TIGR02216 family)